MCVRVEYHVPLFCGTEIDGAMNNKDVKMTNPVIVNADAVCKSLFQTGLHTASIT